MDQERYQTSEVSSTGDTSMVGRAKGAINDQIENAKDTIGNLRPGDNPMLMLLGGLAVGFVIGMLVPVSRFENEQLGPVADDLKGRVREAGAQAVRRGGEAIRESIEAATVSEY